MSDHDFACPVCNVSESTDYLCVKCGHCRKHYCKCPTPPAPRELSAEIRRDVYALQHGVDGPALSATQVNSLCRIIDHITALTAKLEAWPNTLAKVTAMGNEKSAEEVADYIADMTNVCMERLRFAEEQRQRAITAEADNAKLRESMRSVQSLLHFYGKREMDNPANNQEAVRDTRKALDKFDAALSHPAPEKFNPILKCAVNPDWEPFCNVFCAYHPLPKCTAPARESKGKL